MPYGLPPLPQQIIDAVETVQLDAISLTSAFGGAYKPVYGLFTQSGSSAPSGGTNALGTQTNPFQSSAAGAQALTGYASIVGFAFQVDEKLPTYPVEQGGFGTYNKVALPFGAKLSYVVAGGPQNIASFTQQLETLRKNTTLYTVVMPEFAWQNANVIHWDLRRTGSVNGGRGAGISLVTYDVWVQEVRQASNPQFTSTGTQASPTATATPDGQAQQQNGTVQPFAASGSPLANQLNNNPNGFSTTDASGNTTSFGPSYQVPDGGTPPTYAAAGSPLANQLDTTPGAFSSGGTSYGAVYTVPIGSSP